MPSHQRQGAMRRLVGFVAGIVLVMLVSVDTTAAGDERKVRASMRSQIETAMMGGVKHPSDEELAAMQRVATAVGTASADCAAQTQIQ